MSTQAYWRSSTGRYLRLGAVKLAGCCKQAKADGLDYAWIDTCCINKANYTEYGEAINSMFRWYQAAEVCYAILTDVPPKDDSTWKSKFRTSRWFQRGWTLQELLAPTNLAFYSNDWCVLGTKLQLSTVIGDITGIPARFLLGASNLHEASVAQRMSWAAKRTTKKIEDVAYSLFGIFNVTMPMIYGEGTQAFIRLQKEIMSSTADDSILAWGLDPTPDASEPPEASANLFGGALATSPLAFENSGKVICREGRAPTMVQAGVSRGYLQLRLPLHTTKSGQILGLLDCRFEDDDGESAVGLPLCRVAPGEGADEYMRPAESKTIPLPGIDSGAVSKSIRIHGLLSPQEAKSKDRRYGFSIENMTSSDLEMVDVYPPHCWEGTSTFIKTGVDFQHDIVKQTWVRFRHATNAESEDFVIALELEVAKCQPLARCHAMVSSRETTLNTMAQASLTREFLFGKSEACNSALSLKVVLVEERRGAYPIFAVRLSSLTSPPEETVNVTRELALLDQSSNLQNVFREIQQVSPRIDELAGAIEEKTEDVDRTRIKLGHIQQALDELEKEKRLLVDSEERSRTELDRLTQEKEGLLDKEKGMFKMVAMAQQLQAAAGKERASKWHDTIIDYLSYDLLRSTDDTVKSMPDRIQRVFMQAIKRGNKAALQFIRGSLAELDFEDAKGGGILSFAINNSRPPIVAWLIEEGVSIDVLDSYGMTPLTTAAGKGSLAVVRRLLDSGAQIEKKDNRGWTPLAMAVGKRHIEVVRLLLDRGANIEATTTKHGYTPLCLSVQDRGLDGDITSLLLERGARIEAKATDGATPLLVAAQFGCMEGARLLLDRKANLESKDTKGMTPLSLAVKKGHEDVVIFFLDEGAKLEARDDHGRTALHHAVLQDRASFVTLLRIRGADVEARAAAGHTAVYYAIRNGHHGGLQHLLKEGASLLVEGPDGKSPLEYARHVGQKDEDVKKLPGWDGIIQFLEEEESKRAIEEDKLSQFSEETTAVELPQRTEISQSPVETDEPHKRSDSALGSSSKPTRPSSGFAGATLAGRTSQSSYSRQTTLASPRPLGRSTAYRTLSTTSRRFQDHEPKTNENEGLARTADIETTVREAKQRFRDTLPKGYLTEEEYRLYERWYGPPLRETSPEDVGIEYLNVKQPQLRKDGSAGPALLRQVEGGTLQEVQYDQKRRVEAAEDSASPPEAEPTEELAAEGEDNYINIVARNKREYDALMKLQKEFEANALAAKEAEQTELEAEDEVVDEERDFEEEFEEDEDEDGIEDQRTSTRTGRLHPYTREGHFSTNPSTVSLPHVGFVSPVTALLDRTDIKHVRDAAEKAFGGPGLPYSPATPASKMGLEQQPVGMAAWQHKMSDIEADAFVSTFLPPAYASVMGSLVEVRKRLGTEWMRKLFEKSGGPRVLDVGAGGAGLLAWQDVTRAEWEAMRSRGEVTGKNPPGKQSVVVGADKLRSRVSTFLHNTTFLPRLPDYLHSVENAHLHLDANETPQPRKMFDVIIASHLVLPVQEGHRRKAILNKIWSLLNPDGGVLIVLEKGQPRGFEAVAEIRERLLTEFLIPPGGEELTQGEERNPAYERLKEPGMIIAPCTNHRACPMYQVPGKSVGRKDFCHFGQRFVRPPFLQKIVGATHRNHDDVQFSYIAIQRGVAAKQGPLAGDEATDRAFEGFEKSATAPDMHALPRQILPPIKRRGHVTLDVCTPSARIERWTVPKSFSKQAYHDARKAKWGDLWALGAKTRNHRNVRLGRPEVLDDGGVRAQRAKAAESKKKKVVSVGIDEMGVVGGQNEKAAVAPRRKGSRKAARQELMKKLAEED
ncbi:hypothetical protein EsH8_III_001484 [Colletotrichum jinshuiense]